MDRNPNLVYKYPEPTPSTLHNIMAALIGVPKLYTQVLHLMNRMNLPPPFGPPIPMPPGFPSGLQGTAAPVAPRDAASAPAVSASTSVGAAIQARVQSISKEDVIKNRMPAGAILAMPKFSSYTAGAPSKVLYIKNLAPRTSEEELQSLFSRFDNRDGSFNIRLMKEGRMKGQAFVSFKSTEIATQALEDTHGYLLHERPLVISYGKHPGQGSANLSL
eukprot:tig00020614_g12222.t1